MQLFESVLNQLVPPTFVTARTAAGVVIAVAQRPWAAAVAGRSAA